MTRPSKRVCGSAASAGSTKPQSHILHAEHPVLTAAAVVCKSQSGIEHQAPIISSFLDSVCDHWTLEIVLSDAPTWLDEASAVRLLDRLLVHEWTELSAEFRTNRFLKHVKRAGLEQDANPGLVAHRVLAHTAYWLHERGYSLSIDVESEIGRNNLEFMKWIDAHKQQDILRELERGIAAATSISMAQLLLDTFPDTEWDEPEEDACAKVDLEMANEIEDESAHKIWINGLAVSAVEAGQLDVLKYVYDHRLHEPRCELMFDAAQLGHMEIVQFLHGKQPACSEFAIVFAAQLHEQVTKGPSRGTPQRLWRHRHDPSRSIDMAARNGSLELVQWLHAHRTKECTRDAMTNAASNGHLNVLQWLHENRKEGCTSDALYHTARNGHLEVVQWLIKNRKECKRNKTVALNTAAAFGHFKIVEWIHESRSGTSITEVVDGAVEGCYLDIVKFLLEQIRRLHRGCDKRSSISWSFEGTQAYH